MALGITGVTGCYINGDSHKPPGAQYGQYVSILLSSDPSGFINSITELNTLKVYFETQTQWQMEGTTPRANTGFNQSMSEGGRAVGPNSSEVATEYKQWYLKPADSEDEFLDKNAVPEGPYVNQIIVSNFKDYHVKKIETTTDTPIRYDGGKNIYKGPDTFVIKVTDIDVSVDDIVEPGAAIGSGTVVEPVEYEGTNFIIRATKTEGVLGYQNHIPIGGKVTSVLSVDETFTRGDAILELDPWENTLNYADAWILNVPAPALPKMKTSGTSGCGGSKGNAGGNYRIILDPNNEYENYKLIRCNPYMRYKAKTPDNSAYDDGFKIPPNRGDVEDLNYSTAQLKEWDVPGDITYWGRTGTFYSVNNSLNCTIHIKGHGGFATDIGVIFFTANPAGTGHKISDPKGCFPNARYLTVQQPPEDPDPEQGGFYRDWASGVDCTLTLNYTGGNPNYSARPAGPVIAHVLTEADITDKFGTNRLFYVPWFNAKQADDYSNNYYTQIETGNIPSNLGVNKLYCQPPQPAQFDPFSTGYFWWYTGFKYKGEDKSNYRTYDAYNNSKRFNTYTVDSQCRANFISKNDASPYVAPLYLSKLEVDRVIPYERSAISGDSITIKGNFVNYDSLVFSRENKYDLINQGEVGGENLVIKGYSIPTLTVGTLNNKRSAEDISTLIGAQQAGPLNGVTVSDMDGSVNGTLPFVPALDTVSGSLVDICVHSRLRGATSGLSYEDKFMCKENPENLETIDVISITPSVVPNSYNTSIKILGDLGEVVSITATPTGVNDAAAQSTFVFDKLLKFNDPQPGGYTCNLPAEGKESEDKKTKIGINDFFGMYDITIVSNKISRFTGESVRLVHTVENAINLTARTGPKIRLITPIEAIEGFSQIKVYSATPGEITARNLYSIMFGEIPVYVMGEGSIQQPEDLIEGGDVVGITFYAPDADNEVASNFGRLLDVKIRTLIDSNDIPIKTNLNDKTKLSIHFNSIKLIERIDDQLPAFGPSFDFNDPTGIFRGVSQTERMGLINGLKEISTTDPSAVGYQQSHVSRNTVGLGKSIDGESDKYVIENIEPLVPAPPVPRAGLIDAPAKTDVNYDSGDPTNVPFYYQTVPMILCTISNKSALSQVQWITPSYIEEDLLIIPDEEADPFNVGNYSYMAGFNFEYIPSDYSLVIQNVNSKETFTLDKYINKDRGDGGFDNLKTAVIPPGYFGVDKNGYVLAMNLTGVFGKNKLIREAIVFFADEKKMVLEDIGFDSEFNGYTGGKNSDIENNILEGYSSGFRYVPERNDSTAENGHYINWESKSPTIPGRGRYILIMHDSLIDDYLYPGFVDLQVAPHVGDKLYAPSTITLNSNLETTTNITNETAVLLQPDDEAGPER